LNNIEAHGEENLKTLQTVFDSTDGMISFQEAVCLYELARKVRSGCILEIGSYRGRSTVFLGKGSLDGANIPVFAIDPHATFTGILGGIFGSGDRAIFYRTMLANDCSEIVSLINLSSEFFSNQWKSPVSLLWIDGDHSYEGVRRDFYCWEPHLLPEAFIAFDDALDPNLGPFRLIDELVKSMKYQKLACVGKVVVLKCC
jgi:predicted O-methyltransferase YrrM